MCVRGVVSVYYVLTARSECGVRGVVSGGVVSGGVVSGGVVSGSAV